MIPPPTAVLRAFGAAPPAEPLPGGQGTSWRAGAVVLKPVEQDAVETVTWLHSVRGALRPTPLRLALPRTAADGRVVHQGWTATDRLEGAQAADPDLLAGTARAFAAAFAAIDPGTLPRREDPWAIADGAAWGEEPGPLHDHPLVQALEPVDATPQIVHGDLAGNVLIGDALPPAVIDLSLFDRPVEWSVAVLAVDSVSFAGAPTTTLDTISPDRAFPQLVARAVLFRMTVDAMHRAPPSAAYDAVRTWLRHRL